MSLPPIEWTNPTTVAQALAQLEAGAVAKAGGVDVIDLLKEGIVAPRRLVNLRTIPGLDRIVEDERQGLHLGPLVTLARLAAEPVVQKRYRALAQAAGHAATPQVRNMATLGGNLLQRPRCWYFRSQDFPCWRKGGSTCFAIDGENAYHAIHGNARCAMVSPSATAVALMALGATLEIAGPKGTRLVPIERFYVRPEQGRNEHVLDPRELLVGIRVPRPGTGSGAGAETAYLKQREKKSFDWPLAEVAVAIARDGAGRCTRASVVLGAFAPVPHRSREAERALVGQVLDERTARAAARAAMQVARPLSQNAYKVPVFEAIIWRTLLQAVKA